MILKSQAFPKRSDQIHLKTEFSQFGDCSINFAVIFIQPTETIIKYTSPDHAERAFLTLNNQKFHKSRLTLERFLSNPEPPFPNSSPKILDIEITIPTKPIIFLSALSDLTPSSYPSPCFPDIAQSSIESSKSSGRSDMGLPESPVSVSRLPIGNPWKNSTQLEKDYENEEGKVEIPLILPIPPLKRKFEGMSLTVPIISEKDDNVFCEYCKKTLKKKSLKAHNASKLHQSNIKKT